MRADDRYDTIAIALHWAIAALILANIPLGAFGEQIEAGLGTSLVWLHKSIGLTVLALSLVRLAWRLTHRPPPLADPLPEWQARAARIVHRTFYGLIIAVPLTGWLRVSAGSYPLTWFGLIDLPKFPIAPRSAGAQAASTAHEILAWSMAALIALHIAAALHHHWIRRDRTLRRMLVMRQVKGRRTAP
jgi:cytochrome b561